MKMRLKHIHMFADRNGRLRYYHRRGGERIALPDPAKGHDAFMRAYNAAESGKAAPAHDAGTLAALMTEYLASSDFKALKPNSQVLYRRVIEFLRKRPSAAAHVAEVRRRSILALRDEMADRPAMANVTLSVISMLMKFAIERDYRDDNPAAGIKRFTMGEHRAWTSEEHAAFRARWPSGSMERRAYMLALHTGQRRGDLSTMTWKDRRDGLIYVVQEKTGEKLAIPEHRDLAAELATVTDRHIAILHTGNGNRFTPERLGIWFSVAIDEAGLPDACVLHGLRKSATAALADAGCSEREIMAVTGHRTTRMVSHYAKSADQKRMAVTAIRKREDDAG